MKLNDIEFLYKANDIDIDVYIFDAFFSDFNHYEKIDLNKLKELIINYINSYDFNIIKNKKNEYCLDDDDVYNIKNFDNIRLIEIFTGRYFVLIDNYG
jgi:hypothetical protein